MEEEGDVRGPLFERIVFTVIPGDGLDETLTRDVVQALTSSGARHVPLREDDNELDEIETLTHIISTHVDFPQYSQVLQLGIYVVKPDWVYQSMRKRKLATTRQYSPDPSQFFHDVVVTTADLPEGDAEAIVGGVIALGGQHSPRMSKAVTHIVTNSMEHPKVEMAENVAQCKIVLPHWFHACFSLGKKIGERPYLLPDPEILRREHTSNVRALASPHIDGAASASPTKTPNLTPPPSPSYLRKTLNAFKGKKVFLAEDLDLSEDLVQMLTKLIRHSEGLVTSSVDDSDIYIGHFREGPEYVAASQAGKEVANLSWLYHVINRNKYTSPLRRLFHYPVPREGVRGFKNLKISLSNYSGEARTYVENLIRACGAEYTKTMKQDNTHLITAHKSGEKCEAAAEWDINIVNHLWLEESYAKCTALAISNGKYTTFPARTNLGEVTGQTSLSMKSVERIHFPKPRSPQKQASAQGSTSHKTTPISAKTPSGATGHEMEMDEPVVIANDDMELDSEAAPTTSKKPRGRPPKSAMATPRFAPEEKENDSPQPLSTGRAAKNKALDSIHGSAADIAQYQKERARKGGVIYGGRRESAQESSPAPQRNSKKRPSDEYDPTGMGSDLSDGETQDARAKQTKKAKTAATPALPPVEYRMMVTGDERWNNNAKKESSDRTTLRGLGIQLTQDPKAVDILVAPKILRTKKFVCALASAPLVVDSSFLDTALNKKKLIEDPPMLKDRDGEDRLGFKLSDALERAKANKRKLFRGWTIFVTEDINGGFETYKDIISMNGGSAMLYKGRLGVTVTKRKGRDDPEAGEEASNQGDDEERDFVYLISGKTAGEVKLWKTFRENASKQDLEARIVASDWLLNAAMSQMITLDQKWLLNEEDVMSQRKG